VDREHEAPGSSGSVQWPRDEIRHAHRRALGAACGRSCRKIKTEPRQRMHQPIPSLEHWLRQVVTGRFAYYAVPTNSRALSAFRHYVAELWRRTLRRRSQKDGFTWDRVTKLVARWLGPAMGVPRSKTQTGPSGATRRTRWQSLPSSQLANASQALRATRDRMLNHGALSLGGPGDEQLENKRQNCITPAGRAAPWLLSGAACRSLR
jgi:hypothetical protein